MDRSTLLAVCLLCFLIIAMCIYLARLHLHSTSHAEPPRIWHFYRYHGGATVRTPRAMTEEEAVDYCGKNLGYVAWIDRQHGFIFFKPTGG